MELNWFVGSNDDFCADAAGHRYCVGLDDHAVPLRRTFWVARKDKLLAIGIGSFEAAKRVAAHDAGLIMETLWKL